MVSSQGPPGMACIRQKVIVPINQITPTMPIKRNKRYLAIVYCVLI